MREMPNSPKKPKPRIWTVRERGLNCTRTFRSSHQDPVGPNSGLSTATHRQTPDHHSRPFSPHQLPQTPARNTPPSPPPSPTLFQPQPSPLSGRRAPPKKSPLHHCHHHHQPSQRRPSQSTLSQKTMPRSSPYWFQRRTPANPARVFSPVASLSPSTAPAWPPPPSLPWTETPAKTHRLPAQLESQETVRPSRRSNQSPTPSRRPLPCQMFSVRTMGREHRNVYKGWKATCHAGRKMPRRTLSLMLMTWYAKYSQNFVGSQF